MAQIALTSTEAAVKGRKVAAQLRKASAKRNNLQVQKALTLEEEAVAWLELKESGVLRSTRKQVYKITE